MAITRQAVRDAVHAALRGEAGPWPLADAVANYLGLAEDAPSPSAAGADSAVARADYSTGEDRS